MTENIIGELATVQDLESTITSLNDHLDSTLDVQSARDKFEEMASLLEQKKQDLGGILVNLEKTKETMKEELDKRYQEEQDLANVINGHQKEKSELDQHIENNQNRIGDIQTEKERLSILIHNMKLSMDQMKEKLAQVL